MWISSRFSQCTKHSFCFDNRLSYALSKYPNFPALLGREMRSFFFYASQSWENCRIFWERMWILSRFWQWAKHSFCLDNRPSYAPSKYPNFPALPRRKMRSFFFYVSLPHRILLFFENICEYHQASINALSTVFVLITDFLMRLQNTLISRLSSAEKCDHYHLMPFQNSLISRLSSAEKCDHFPFLSATLTESYYFLRTYVNIIKVLSMR